MKSDKQYQKSSIPVTHSTRRLVQEQKRGGESYDQLLRKMVAQYEPEVTAE